MSVYQTESAMSCLFATAATVPEALHLLAETLREEGLDQHVIDLSFLVNDDGEYTVGALLEVDFK